MKGLKMKSVNKTVKAKETKVVVPFIKLSSIVKDNTSNIKFITKQVDYINSFDLSKLNELGMEDNWQKEFYGLNLFLSNELTSAKALELLWLRLSVDSLKPESTFELMVERHDVTERDIQVIRHFMGLPTPVVSDELPTSDVDENFTLKKTLKELESPEVAELSQSQLEFITDRVMAEFAEPIKKMKSKMDELLNAKVVVPKVKKGPTLPPIREVLCKVFNKKDDKKSKNVKASKKDDKKSKNVKASKKEVILNGRVVTCNKLLARIGKELVLDPTGSAFFLESSICPIKYPESITKKNKIIAGYQPEFA